MNALAAALPAPRRLPALDGLRAVARFPQRRAAPAAATHRAIEVLRRERTLWLTTRDRQSGAHVVPVPYTWDGEALWIFAKPGQRKLENIARDPRVMLAVGNPDGDLDVQLIEARGEVVAGPAEERAPLAAHLARHRAAIAAGGIDEATYASRYRQAVRLVPTRYLPWRARG